MSGNNTHTLRDVLTAEPCNAMHMFATQKRPTRIESDLTATDKSSQFFRLDLGCLLRQVQTDNKSGYTPSINLGAVIKKKYYEILNVVGCKQHRTNGENTK